MIEVRNLNKSFETKQVLFDISATFMHGHVNQIIGQSGSGKTVLMKSVIGLFRAESGEVLYDGRNLSAMSEKEVKNLRREVGMLFQGSALFDSMSVLGNVMFPLEMFADMTKAEMERRAIFCLERVDLKPTAFSLSPSEISGGMQKRVAIARAIALNPKYLFCDEPNSGLDPVTSLVIDKLIQDITFDAYNRAFTPNRTPYDWVCSREEVIDAYAADPYCTWQPTIQLCSEMMKGMTMNQKKGNLCRMQKNLPIFFFAGQFDPVGRMGNGVLQAAQAFKDAGMKDVTVELYPNMRHECHNETGKEKVFGDILLWIESKAK